MRNTIYISISTGSDRHVIAPEVIFAHIATVLKGTDIRGHAELVLIGDGTIYLDRKQVFVPKRPKMDKPVHRRKR